MNKPLLAAFVFTLFFVSAAFAVDTAIVATDKASVDGMVAAVAGSRAGAPVFIAESGEVSQETVAAIQGTGAANVVIVGGPAVVSESSETSLGAAGFTVVRLWGIERTGTAIEVAKYFFADGDCAVLVDDTMDSDADTRRLAVAANLAIRKECALIPVPRGDIPASVLDTLKSLGFSDVYYVGIGLDGNLRLRLREFRLRELAGNDSEVEDEVEDEIGDNSTKLILIAAPNWPHALSFGGMPHRGALVKILTSANQTDRAIAFIQAHNITDVRVVGKPDLAAEIAARLQAAGINATVVSGERAAEVSRKLWAHMRERFENLSDERGERIAEMRERMKERLWLILNSTQAELEAEKAELEASGENVTVLIGRLDAALDLIAQAKIQLEAGNVEAALRLWAQAHGRFFVHKWNDRGRIKWEIRDMLEEEESDVDDILEDARKEISDMSDALARVRERCAASNAIERLVNRSKSLREEISAEVQAGNYGRAAQLVKEVHILIEQAKHLRDICERRGDVPQSLKDIAERHRGRTDNMFMRISRERMMEIEGDEAQEGTIVVEFTDSGYKPTTVRIKKGSTVLWTNNASTSMWPASAMHPTHRVYPGSDIAKCDTEDKDEIFDACINIPPGSTYQFEFDERGQWRYHDHLNPRFTGSVIVE